jgi:hypothetical protein
MSSRVVVDRDFNTKTLDKGLKNRSEKTELTTKNWILPISKAEFRLKTEKNHVC